MRFLLDPRRRVLIAHPRNLQSKGLDHICFTRLGCFKRLLIPRRKQKVKALHSRFVYSTPPSQSRGTAPFQSTPPNLKLAKVPQNSQRETHTHACKPLAGPCSCMHPCTNSSREILRPKQSWTKQGETIMGETRAYANDTRDTGKLARTHHYEVDPGTKYHALPFP